MNNKNKLESKLINSIEDIIKDLSANQLNVIGNHILQLSKNKTPSPSSSGQLTILYGSQTGNSRSIAEELYEEMKNHNIQSSLQSMGKFREKELYIPGERIGLSKKAFRVAECCKTISQIS